MLLFLVILDLIDARHVGLLPMVRQSATEARG